MTTASAKEISRIQLPAKLNSAAAAKLLEEIKARHGGALNLDAAGVTMIGGQCLQILVAAFRDWTESGGEFCVVNLSEPMRGSLSALGVSAEQIGARETKNGS